LGHFLQKFDSEYTIGEEIVSSSGPSEANLVGKSLVQKSLPVRTSALIPQVNEVSCSKLIVFTQPFGAKRCERYVERCHDTWCAIWIRFETR
jgi:hypothetical protein